MREMAEAREGVSLRNGLRIVRGALIVLGVASRSHAVMGQDNVAGDQAGSAGYPPPTLVNVAYGNDPGQALDFWKANSSSPTPLVFYVHGGAWYAGKKTDFSKGVGALRVGDLLAAGISVVSVEYRFTPVAQEAGITPLVK